MILVFNFLQVYDIKFISNYTIVFLLLTLTDGIQGI